MDRIHAIQHQMNLIPGSIHPTSRRMNLIHGHVNAIAHRMNPIHGSDSRDPADVKTICGHIDDHGVHTVGRVPWNRMPRARVPDEDAARFGAMVARLRTDRDWTLADLSRASGMNATWLGVLERGGNMPSLATIFKLAEVFGVEAAELVREVEETRWRPLTPRRSS